MVIYNSFNNKNLVKLIKAGGIGVIPTDTIYGLVCLASDKDAVETVFNIKGRDLDKPPIILISSTRELRSFGVVLSPVQKELLKTYWPGSVSVILSSSSKELQYLSRGHSTLTFRLPSDNKLVSLLQKTGPVIAPSANPQGLTPARNIDEAVDYFVGEIDFAVDGGVVESQPSTLVDLSKDTPKILRQGDAKI
jgi:L-threonylcarbamoyladenylate synthase